MPEARLELWLTAANFTETRHQADKGDDLLYRTGSTRAQRIFRLKGAERRGSDHKMVVCCPRSPMLRDSFDYSDGARTQRRLRCRPDARVNCGALIAPTLTVAATQHYIESERIVTPTSIELATTAEDHRIARYAAAAIALTVAEAAIPMPLPGVKPGLANIVLLVVLERYGWRDAVWVSLLRVVAGSLLLGQFLAPGFFLSLAGSVASLAALGVAMHLPRRWFGPVSRSVCAAFAHIAGQLVVARLWLVPHDGVFYLVPLFAAAALVFGLANGLAAAKLLQEDGRREGATDAADGNGSSPSTST